MALGCSLSTTSAFSVQLQSQHLQPRSFGVVSVRSNKANCVSYSRVKTQRKLAENDDEEDGYDEPLSKGVDSVSWLPTVVGAKSVEADSEGGEVSAEVGRDG